MVVVLKGIRLKEVLCYIWEKQVTFQTDQFL